MNLIYDRTQADVEEAKLLRGNVLISLRGCYNVADMNRVTAAVSELAAQLNLAGYGVSVSVREYSLGELIRKSDWRKYLANVQALRDAYYVRADTPELPKPTDRRSIEGANAIERTLYDISVLVDCMKASYRKCGTFAAGNNAVHLPLKRS
ncbi:MAG: hypothetical protein HFE63_03440 [Clostridiales bacterium]|nr:hypothetical protein [Clostridiales bacterium]